MRCRPDGWPLCPRCGEDEAYSLATPPDPAVDLRCYVCGPLWVGGGIGALGNWPPPAKELEAIFTLIEEYGAASKALGAATEIPETDAALAKEKQARVDLYAAIIHLIASKATDLPPEHECVVNSADPMRHRAGARSPAVPDRPGQWMVVRVRETDPAEVYRGDYAEMNALFENLGNNWTETFLLRVVVGPSTDDDNGRGRIDERRRR